MRGWNGYWFAPAPLLDLAIVRIILVGTQLILLLSHNHYLIEDFRYLVGLPDELYFPLPVLKILTLPLGADFRPSFEFLVAVRVLAIGAASLALVGLFTRVSLAVLALATTIIISHAYSFGDVHHPAAPLIIAFMILAVSPSGQLLSIDAWLRRGSIAEKQVDWLDSEHPMAGWPIKLLQWQFVLIYLSAVLSKLVFYGGIDWVNGYSLQARLIAASLSDNGTLLGMWLSQHYYFVLIGQIGVVLLQSTFTLAIIFPALRWIYVPAGFCFHIANIFVLNVHFPEWLALYAIFIPWRRAIELLTKRGPNAARAGPA